MIFLYYGKIGDGKTYHVVANEILPAVRAGRKIYTNIDSLDGRYISERAGVSFGSYNVEIWPKKEQPIEFLQVEIDDPEGKSLKIDKGALVVIDEAQMIWDARNFKNTGKGFLTLLEYHRHYGLDFVFITQNVRRLEKSITMLANHSYQVKNLKIFGSLFKNKYIVNYRQTPYDDVLSQRRGSFDDKIFRCYRSGVVIREDKSIRLPSWSYLMLIPLAAIIMFGRQFTNDSSIIFGSHKKPKALSSGFHPDNSPPLTLPEKSSSSPPVDRVGRVDNSRRRPPKKQCGGFMKYEGEVHCLDPDRFTCQPCTLTDLARIHAEENAAAELSTLSTQSTGYQQRPQGRTSAAPQLADAVEPFEAEDAKSSREGQQQGAGSAPASRRAVPRPDAL